MAEANGATEAQIRRAGRWNAEKMEGCYLTTLPKGAMRALAGFNPNGGGFSLKRAVVSVPAVLTAQVFSAVMQWTEPGRVEDIAGQGFVKLILSLRSVLLQDAAVLRSRYLTHPLWQHRIFRSPEFSVYAADVVEACSSSTELVDSSLERVLHILTSVVQTGLSSLGDRMVCLQKQVERIDGRVETMMEKGFKVVLNDDVVTSGMPLQSSTTLSSFQAATMTNSSPNRATGSHGFYKMSRNLQSVVDVWSEYVTGIDGRPAVRDLEITHGTSWRQPEPDRRYFSRRKVFYDAIETIAAEHGVEQLKVAQALDVYRKGQGKTLDGMMKFIKERGALNFL